jgi:hypothetical protein
MEDLSSIILPDLSKNKVKRAKPAKTVLVEKQELSRVNRTVTCGFCENEKILNPDQYQSLFESLGSEEKIQEEFMCKSCEVSMRRNPFDFWTRYGEHYQTLSKSLRQIFDRYAASNRTSNDALILQNSTFDVIKNCKILPENIEFVIDNLNPVALKIKSVPFVGEVLLRIYEPKNSRIRITG